MASTFSPSLRPGCGGKIKTLPWKIAARSLAGRRVAFQGVHRSKEPLDLLRTRKFLKSLDVTQPSSILKSRGVNVWNDLPLAAEVHFLHQFPKVEQVDFSQSTRSCLFYGKLVMAHSPSVPAPPAASWCGTAACPLCGGIEYIALGYWTRDGSCG
jgi:hypothetical protein